MSKNYTPFKNQFYNNYFFKIGFGILTALLVIFTGMINYLLAAAYPLGFIISFPFMFIDPFGAILAAYFVSGFLLFAGYAFIYSKLLIKKNLLISTSILFIIVTLAYIFYWQVDSHLRNTNVSTKLLSKQLEENIKSGDYTYNNLHMTIQITNLRNYMLSGGFSFSTNILASGCGEDDIQLRDPYTHSGVHTIKPHGSIIVNVTCNVRVGTIMPGDELKITVTAPDKNTSLQNQFKTTLSNGL